MWPDWEDFRDALVFAVSSAFIALAYLLGLIAICAVGYTLVWVFTALVG